MVRAPIEENLKLEHTFVQTVHETLFGLGWEWELRRGNLCRVGLVFVVCKADL